MNLDFLPIPPVDETIQNQVRIRQHTLIKPIGALGRLEELSVRLAGMTGRMDWLPERRLVVVCAADHGIAEQGVSTVPQAITAYMVNQFLNGNAAINSLTRQMKAQLVVVDAGVNADLSSHPLLFSRKVAYGTADFSQQQAMTDTQAEQAITIGFDTVERFAEDAADIIAVGEMGIGNTTAASAIIAAITGQPPLLVTGRGSGLDDEAWQRKIMLIEQALTIHRPVDEDTLAKLGGFEIGAMAGVIIRAAARQIPVVIDGLISTAAAIIAAQLQPNVTQYLIAGHQSVEPGHQIALEWLGLEPLLDLGLCLGEGTGAVLTFPIIEAAMRTMQEMAILELP